MTNKQPMIYYRRVSDIVPEYNPNKTTAAEAYLKHFNLKEWEGYNHFHHHFFNHSAKWKFRSLLAQLTHYHSKHSMEKYLKQHYKKA